MFMVYLAAVLIVVAVLLILFNVRMLRKPAPPSAGQKPAPAAAPQQALPQREAQSAPARKPGPPAAPAAADDGLEEGDRAYRSAIRRESGIEADAAGKPSAEPENPAYADDTYRGALRSLKHGDKS